MNLKWLLETMEQVGLKTLVIDEHTDFSKLVKPMDYYRLVGKEIVPCTMHEWGQSYKDDSRRIGDTTINDVRISTVFLGVEHVGGMFETMIFGGEHDDYQERCETYDEALAMHEEAVRMVRQLR